MFTPKTETFDEAGRRIRLRCQTIGHVDHWADECPDGECATGGCHNRAAWLPIVEGNKWGSDAPRRCRECCDAIRALNIPAGGLYHVAQLGSWGKIHADFKSVGDDGVRRVLAWTQWDTSLVPWYGPAAS